MNKVRVVWANLYVCSTFLANKFALLDKHIHIIEQIHL